MTNNHKQTWGSHVPLNKSLLKTFDISGVLELGIGFNSTPLFFQSCDNVISVENDLDWIEKIKSEKIVVETDTKYIIHHDVGDIKRTTRRHDLSDSFLISMNEYYKSLDVHLLNMLFVDQYSSLRLESLKAISDCFDVVVYHDVQRPGINNHYYGGFIPSDKFDCFIDKSYKVWTGLLINKELVHKIDKLKEILDKETYNYTKSESLIVQELAKDGDM